MEEKKLVTKLVPGIGRVPIPAYRGMDKYIFVSYAHVDHELVFNEIKRFNEVGYHVWYDEGINPGSEWPKEIARALSNCSLFVLMVTPESIVRRNVQNEINYALKKEKPFIAIHLKETELPEAMELQFGAVQAIHKYMMTDEEYDYKYITAFERFGLRDNRIDGDDDQTQPQHGEQTQPQENLTRQLEEKLTQQQETPSQSMEEPTQKQDEEPAQKQDEEPAQKQDEEPAQKQNEESVQEQKKTEPSDKKKSTPDKNKDKDKGAKVSFFKKHKKLCIIVGISLAVIVLAAIILTVFVFNKPIGDNQKHSASDETLKMASTNSLNTLSQRLTDIRDGDKPVLPASYETDNQVLKDAAYTYDNALTAMAFIANDDSDKAAAILDAFVYASENDRYKAGRIRNAYAAGNIIYTDENGKESAKLPGWYDQQWNEDPVQVGANTGNTSFAVLAMLQYDEAFGNDKYLKTAQTLMDWVMTDCTDSVNGFTTGYNGWPENRKETNQTYKSTAYNIAAYAAFSQLYAETEREDYKKAANSALAFVKSMYVEGEGYFCTGTLYDGSSMNQGTVTLDAQVWSALALGEDFKPFIDTLDTIAEMKTEEGAYPYCKDNKNGGFWSEGTAFTALMYSVRNDKNSDSENYYSAMEALNGISDISGLFPSASVADLYTGSALESGDLLVIGNDRQVAPTAWFVLAEKGFNPFSFDHTQQVKE